MFCFSLLKLYPFAFAYGGMLSESNSFISVKIGIESKGGGKGCKNIESAIPFSFIVKTLQHHK